MPSPETQSTQIGFVFNFFTAVLLDPVLIFDCQDKASWLSQLIEENI